MNLTWLPLLALINLPISGVESVQVMLVAPLTQFVMLQEMPALYFLHARLTDVGYTFGGAVAFGGAVGAAVGDGLGVSVGIGVSVGAIVGVGVGAGVSVGAIAGVAVSLGTAVGEGDALAAAINDGPLPLFLVRLGRRM